MAREAAFRAHGSARRTAGLDQYLGGGTAVVYVRYRDTAPPYRVAGHANQTHHIRLVRLVVPLASKGDET